MKAVAVIGIGKTAFGAFPDRDLRSLAVEAGRPVTVAELIPLAEHHLADVFGAVTWRRADVASLLPDADLSPAAP